MKKLILSLLVFLTALVFAQTGSTATIGLYDYAFNIDGTLSDSSPANVDFSAFNDVTGIGTVSITISGPGTHYVGGFFDLEIDEGTNTYFNEYGSTLGTTAVGQTWEIDEPGYVFGDIYDNFLISQLDTTNSVPGTDIDDVSMAIAYDFALDIGEQAVIEFILSTEMDAAHSGIYLTQTDSNSNETIYFYSTLVIAPDAGGGEDPVPEPSTMILFGVGLLGLARAGRRQK